MRDWGKVQLQDTVITRVLPFGIALLGTEALIFVVGENERPIVRQNVLTTSGKLLPRIVEHFLRLATRIGWRLKPRDVRH